MTYQNRILLSITAVAIAIGVGFVALLSFAFSDLCGNEELETIYSPDGASKGSRVRARLWSHYGFQHSGFFAACWSELAE
jgi:hypothetical protein